MTESTGTALATVDRSYQGLQMAVAPAEALRRVQELQAFVKEVMIQGEDYGTIPGTEKPTLLQPGAQKLAEIYGLAPRFEDVSVTEVWPPAEPFFFYRKKCVLVSRRSGDVVAEGVGSCNSREDRYAYRWVFESELPAGADKRTLTRRERTSKKNGRPYTQFRLQNPDICSLVNTIEKMACKRAYVAAVISATRSAGIFTQDVEDLPESVFGKAEERRSWEDSDDEDDVAQTHPMEEQVREWVEAFAKASNGAEFKAVKEAVAAKQKELTKQQLALLKDAKTAAHTRLKSAAPPTTSPTTTTTDADKPAASEPANQLPPDQDRGPNPDAY
jgi:hypothetical protein